MENQKQLNEKEIVNAMVYGYACACTDRKQDKIMFKVLERFAELNNIPNLSKMKTNDNN